MYRKKNKKELIEILRHNNHPNSVNLEKFTKEQLKEIIEKSCLISLTPINTINNEEKEKIIENISTILKPKD